MRRLGLVMALVAIPALAQARAWKNVSPGNTPIAEVTRRFGEPTTQLKRGKQTVYAYEQDEAIAGTSQAQFIVGPSGTVEQIAVFPAAVIEKAAIEATYGPDCAQKPGGNCFIRKVSDESFKTYYWYASAGLVVFFTKDGKSVESFLYVKPERQQASGQGQKSSDAR